MARILAHARDPLIFVPGHTGVRLNERDDLYARSDIVQEQLARNQADIINSSQTKYFPDACE